MGLLTDLFVANEHDALAYATSNGLGNPVVTARVELGDLTNLEFEVLWAILRGEEWNTDQHALREVWHGSDNESWLFEFPEQYVSALSTLQPAEAARAVTAWAASDARSPSPEEIAPVLQHLASLARAVGKPGDRLFLWFSL